MQQLSPEAYQPRLSVWGHVWRYLLATSISAFGLVTSAAQWSPWQQGLDLALGAVAAVLVFWRRRSPVPVTLVLTLFVPFSMSAQGFQSLALASLATRRRWREILPMSALTIVGAVVWTQTQEAGRSASPWSPAIWFAVNVGINVIVCAALVAWGMYVGSRRELIATLRQRAETAESEQAERVQRARETERRRIAREMHDVLAHRISHISMQAGALAFREDLSAGQLRGEIGTVRHRAHEALQDLRTVLGVLRGNGEDTETAPQPTYADLGRLLDASRESGMRIEVRDDIDTSEGDVPDAVGRTIYRVVQEGVTNARKHAPETTLRVALRGSRDRGIRLELRNPLGFTSHTPGSGLGLVGLTERVELAGGELEHRVESDVFVLEAWLLWGQ